MKLNKNYIQTFIFILVYLFAIYFWSQPFHDKKVPYGEYDAMSHFQVGDYIAYNDESFMALPSYIDIRYGRDNDFRPHTLWYPPTFHTSLGVMEIIGGERIIPVYLLNTIMATFIIITSYFVINSLFGFLPAILSSLLLIFSPRDFMPFLWGQWPERFAYAFIPLILYCLYKYYISYSKQNSQPKYLYLMSLFLGINMLIHPFVFFHSLVGMFVLYILLWINLKKFAFNIKHVIIALLILVVFFAIFPYQTGNIFVSFQSSTSGEKELPSLSRLFHWSLDPKDFVGSVPAFYFSFKEMHGSWTLPFLLLGIFFLLLRREKRDLFLLAWLISLYLVLHRDMIGIATFLHRSLSATAHVFAPLTAIGAVYLASFIKLPKNYKNYLKFAIAIVFVYLVFSVNMASASKLLNKEVYNPYTQSGFFTTLNDAEYQAGQWILENVPQGYNISVLGIVHDLNILSATAKKIRWLGAVSQHVTRFYYLLETDEERKNHLENFYIMVDYSMLIPLSNQEQFANLINDMQEFEQNTLKNHTLLYNDNENHIRVYKLETKQ